jgi:uncharacterized protein YgiM (DUF1202 family)
VKRLFFTFSVFTLIFISFSILNAKEYEIKVKEARLRAGPGTTYKIVGSLQKGDKVTFISKKDTWFRIKTKKGGIAWVHSKLLQPVYLKAKKYEIKVKKATLRSGPGTTYKIVGSLKKGDKVTFISKKDTWFRIKTKKGGIAWVHSKLLQPVNLIKPKKTSKIKPLKKLENIYIKDGNKDLKDNPDGNIIATVKQGTKVKILNRKGKWLKVELNGWMEEKPITKIDEAESPSSAMLKEGRIKEGFKYQKLKLLQVLDLIEIVGEMINISQNKYKTTNFIITLYNDRVEILGAGNIIINSFNPGQTKTFHTLIDNVSYDEIDHLKIQFNMGF